jgi:hypothetical protein
VASGAVIVKSVPPAHAVKRHVATMTTVPVRDRPAPSALSRNGST